MVHRELRRQDAHALFAFRSDEVVQRYNGGAISSLTEASKLIEQMDLGLQNGTMLHWGVTLVPDDTVIGLFGYANWSTEHRRAEIGYCLHREYWGQGLALEAFNKILSYWYRSMKLNRIHARPWLENVRSIRLLEKAGFVREGVLRDEFYFEESFHDEAHYALLRREFDGWEPAGRPRSGRR